jgi:hypothetical protein
LIKRCLTQIFCLSLGTDSSTDQIQTRDLIQLIRAAAEDEEIPAVFIDFLMQQALQALPPQSISPKELKSTS